MKFPDDIPVKEKFDEVLRDMRSKNIENLCVHAAAWADELEKLWDEAEIEIREKDAMFLLKEYAACDDERLSPGAIDLKYELLKIAEENKAGTFAKKLRDDLLTILRWSSIVAGILFSGVVIGSSVAWLTGFCADFFSRIP